jgi:DivIVA domain-containing protein
VIGEEQPEFAVVLRGYDRAQVDEYIAALRKLVADREARGRAHAGELDPWQVAGRQAEEILSAARRTAEVRFQTIIARAEEQAARLLADADAEAETALERARDRAGRVLADAEERAERRLAEAEHDAARLVSDARSRWDAAARAHATAAERLVVLLDEIGGRVAALNDWRAGTDALAAELVATVEPLLGGGGADVPDVDADEPGLPGGPSAAAEAAMSGSKVPTPRREVP